MSADPVSIDAVAAPVSYRAVDFEDAAQGNYPLPTWERDWEDALKYDGMYATGIWRFEGDTPVEFIGCDGGEPEDQTLGRDWAWVVKALNAAVEHAAHAEAARRAFNAASLLPVLRDYLASPGAAYRQLAEEAIDHLGGGA